MFWGRLIVLGILAVWEALTVPFERSGLYLAAIAAFALLGAPPYLLARRGIGGTPVTAAFLLLDAGILTYILIVRRPSTSMAGMWALSIPSVAISTLSISPHGCTSSSSWRPITIRCQSR